MALYLEGVDFCDHFLDLVDAWITKLHDMVTIQTDQMIMLPKAEGGFIFGLRVSELMADYEVGIQKQTERIVDGRTTDRVFLLLQLKVQRICIYMAFGIVYGTKYDKSCLGLPQALTFKKCYKSVADFFALIWGESRQCSIVWLMFIPYTGGSSVFRFMGLRIYAETWFLGAKNPPYI